MVVSWLARIVRLASLAICLLAVASFVAFAVEQSKAGSDRQQAEVDAAAPATASAGSAANVVPTAAGPSKSAFRKLVDGAFAKFSSPFESLTDGIKSQWLLHIANTLLALLVYGFGLGLLARVVRFGD